jgi:hypothetical protein
MENYWTESIHLFKKRLGVYIENQDLLTIKQKDFSLLGRQFVEQELRSQRLIEFYCEEAEKSWTTLRSKQSLQKFGNSIREELNKTDCITADEEKMVLERCDLIHGQSASLYDKIDEVLDKIKRDVREIKDKRDHELLKVERVSWTNVEIAQLLVAVLNLGEGDWLEIQKRINFQTSGYIKTPN